MTEQDPVRTFIRWKSSSGSRSIEYVALVERIDPGRWALVKYRDIGGPGPDVWHDWGSIIRITPSTHKTNRYVRQIVRYCRQFGIDKEIIQALDAPPRGPVFPTSTWYVTTNSAPTAWHFTTNSTSN